MITTYKEISITTDHGMMRCLQFEPKSSGHFPTLIFYSEIFQITAPIQRSAALLAGLGFIVLVPEVFHEFNPCGTVLAYDENGKDKGNQDKFSKSLESHDADTQSMIQHIKGLENSNGQIGSMGVCIGGHLAFRAAIHSDIQSAFCLYPTDIHSNTLACKAGNDSLTRSVDIQGEVFLVFGKQDPHVPDSARALLYAHFNKVGLNYHWLEVNAQHAFMRDEGERYDSQLALDMYLQAQRFFQRTLSS